MLDEHEFKCGNNPELVPDYELRDQWNILLNLIILIRDIAFTI